MNGRWQQLVPSLFGLALLGLWEALVRGLGIAPFILPAPSAIGVALIRDWAELLDAMLFTLRITLLAFGIASVLGLGFAIAFSRNALLKAALYPYAIILQVTPIVSIAPLIIIWVGIDNIETALLILATIVAFFPILSNAVLGFSSVDPNLKDLMRLYGASGTSIFWKLELPAASPQILAGMKIAGGLSLIGAVVAEFVAGSGGATGLAWRIIEAGNRLQIPSMFAALVLLSVLGIALFSILSLIEWLVLHNWHESKLSRE
jgi:NitT/TauT family transport system permease protein